VTRTDVDGLFEAQFNHAKTYKNYRPTWSLFDMYQQHTHCDPQTTWQFIFDKNYIYPFE